MERAPIRYTSVHTSCLFARNINTVTYPALGDCHGAKLDERCGKKIKIKTDGKSAYLGICGCIPQFYICQAHNTVQSRTSLSATATRFNP